MVVNSSFLDDVHRLKVYPKCNIRPCELLHFNELSFRCQVKMCSRGCAAESTTTGWLTAWIPKKSERKSKCEEIQLHRVVRETRRHVRWLDCGTFSLELISNVHQIGRKGKQITALSRSGRKQKAHQSDQNSRGFLLSVRLPLDLRTAHS